MQEFSECIHIKASLSIITQLDAVHSITPSVEFAGMYMNDDHYYDNNLLVSVFVADTMLLYFYRSLLLHGISGKSL